MMNETECETKQKMNSIEMETKRNRPYEVSAGEDSSIKAEKEKRSHTENHFFFFFYVSFLSSIFYCYCQGD